MSQSDSLGWCHDFTEDVSDAAEETFLLFSQDLPHNDLGILDPLATEIELEIGGHDLLIRQSPSLLKSSRETGTTGAVIWKITPLVAAWLSSPQSVLWEKDVLTPSSRVVELGCGIAGLVGITVAPHVASYILTDQDYVMRLLKENVAANTRPSKSTNKVRGAARAREADSSLQLLSFDWEQDSVLNIKHLVPDQSCLDLVILCDCIYNLYLINPLVQNCLDICLMNPTKTTYILIAQQLRTDTVFEQWLQALMVHFQVRRISDDFLPSTLKSTSGYALHIAKLHTATDREEKTSEIP